MSEMAMSLSIPSGLGQKPPRMVIGDSIEIAPEAYVAVGSGWGDGGNGEHPTVGFAADGKSAVIPLPREMWGISRHILDQVPYKSPTREKIRFPKRQKRGGYREPNYPFKFIDETY